MLVFRFMSLRKHAHAIFNNISRLKNVNFQMKFFNTFLIFAQDIDCGYTLGGSNDEAVLMSTHNLCFRAKKKKIMYTPVHPSFTS